jgi:adenylate kinase
VILAMLAERIPEGKAGVIFDGFPRTVAQAEGLDQVGRRLGDRVDLAVKLDVPDDEIIRRLAARRLCPACGTSYNMETQPPRTPGRCDHCGAALVSRNDDLPEVVANRLAVYRRETAPVEAFYQKRGLLRTVNGNRPRVEVERALEALVAECKKQAASPTSRP